LLRPAAAAITAWRERSFSPAFGKRGCNLRMIFIFALVDVSTIISGRMELSTPDNVAGK
jgi:hypothetical protein